MIRARQVEVEAGDRGNDGTPLRPPGRDEFDELTRRLNRLRGSHPPLLRIPRPDVEPDLHDVLNNRLNRLRYGSRQIKKRKL